MSRLDTFIQKMKANHASCSLQPPLRLDRQFSIQFESALLVYARAILVIRVIAATSIIEEERGQNQIDEATGFDCVGLPKTLQAQIDVIKRKTVPAKKNRDGPSENRPHPKYSRFVGNT